MWKTSYFLFRGKGFFIDFYYGVGYLKNTNLALLLKRVFKHYLWFLTLYLGFLCVTRKTGTFFSLPFTFIGESFLEEKDSWVVL